MQRLAEALSQRGHQVTVLTTRYNKSLKRDELLNGVRVVRTWAMLRISRGMIMPAFPLAAWRLIREHDVVSIHSPLLEASLVTTIARFSRKPVVITHHGDLVLPKGWVNRFIESVVFRIYCAAAKSAARITAYSQDYAEHSHWLSRFLGKVRVIYPPIVVATPKPGGAEEMRKRLGLGEGPVVGYAGRFVEEKRPDYLIRAIPYITRRYPNVRIVFAGEYLIKYEDFYDRCAELVDQYKDYLCFLGLVTDDREMACFYSMCDVLALPSGTECFGLVQVESMLFGTPVVATDIPGAREVVRVTGMGELVPKGEERALGEAIVRVLGNRERYVRPREEIEKVFSLRRTVDEYERVFQESIEALCPKGG